MIEVYGVFMTAIPEQVKERIRAKAQSDWPGDFEMQRHTIEKQVAAFRELEALKEKFASDEFIGQIFNFASSSWPDDYEMELHTFQTQLDAGMAFFNYEANDVPSDILEQIKLKAYSEWPDDHEMKLHTLETQLDAWRELQEF
ncbi:MAG: hypothetical protein KA538_12490 [Azonexus sp.]|jgi:hypothetical protein|nr:hypothetical protein [Azonexus sp.]